MMPRCRAPAPGPEGFHGEEPPIIGHVEGALTCATVRFRLPTVRPSSRERHLEAFDGLFAVVGCGGDLRGFKTSRDPAWLAAGSSPASRLRLTRCNGEGRKRDGIKGAG